MNIVDILLPILCVIAAYMGRHRGSVKQTGSLIGIIIGTFIAALIYSLLAYLTESSLVRAVVLALIIAAITFLSYDLFTVFGKYIQKLPTFKKFTGSLYDKIGSAFATGLTVFVVFWLTILLFGSILPSSSRALVKESLILTAASKYVTPPALITNVGKLLQPFSSPDVFASDEPSFDANSLPVTQRYEVLNKSITKVEKSMAKITTWGCGSIGNGSGFMIGKSLVMTSAHVVAGVDRISIENNGVAYVAKAVLFDPKLDIAILSTSSVLVGDPLAPVKNELKSGDIGAVLGYPAGKGLVNDDVVVLQAVQAEGYDIYQSDKVARQIYIVRSNITPGVSGGPLIDAQGRLAGVVVGHSTSDDRIGFIINAKQISSTIKTAHNLKDIVSTGSCAGA